MPDRTEKWASIASHLKNYQTLFYFNSNNDLRKIKWQKIVGSQFNDFVQIKVIVNQKYIILQQERNSI